MEISEANCLLWQFFWRLTLFNLCQVDVFTDVIEIIEIFGLSARSLISNGTFVFSMIGETLVSY